jgi:hypothetical protein
VPDQRLAEWNIQKYSLTALSDEKKKLEKEAKDKKFPETELPARLQKWKDE